MQKVSAITVSSKFKIVFFVCIAVMMFASSDLRAQEAPATAELHIGKTTVVVDRKLLLSVAGRGIRDLGTTKIFDVPPDRSARIALPLSVITSFTPPCEPISFVMLSHGLVPQRKNHSIFTELRPNKTQFRGVSKLEASKGRVTVELYQLNSDDLLDFWGEQIIFYRSAPLVRLGMQLTHDLRIELAATDTQCFFEHAETFVRQLRGFLLSIVKSGQ